MENINDLKSTTEDSEVTGPEFEETSGEAVEGTSIEKGCDSKDCCCSNSVDKASCCASSKTVSNSCCKTGEKVEDGGEKHQEENENGASPCRCACKNCLCDNGDGLKAETFCSGVEFCSCSEGEGNCCCIGVTKTCCLITSNNVPSVTSAKFCSCRCADGSLNLSCSGGKNVEKSSPGLSVCCCSVAGKYAVGRLCCQVVKYGIDCKCCKCYSERCFMLEKVALPEPCYYGKECCIQNCRCRCKNLNTNSSPNVGCMCNLDEASSKACCQKSKAPTQNCLDSCNCTKQATLIEDTKDGDGSVCKSECVCCKKRAAVPICCKLAGENDKKWFAGCCLTLVDRANVSCFGRCVCTSPFSQCCSGFEQNVCPHACNIGKVGCRKNAKKCSDAICKCSIIVDGSSSEDSGVKGVCCQKTDIPCGLDECSCPSKNCCPKDADSCCQTEVRKTCCLSRCCFTKSLGHLSLNRKCFCVSMDCSKQLDCKCCQKEDVEDSCCRKADSATGNGCSCCSACCCSSTSCNGASRNVCCQKSKDGTRICLCKKCNIFDPSNGEFLKSCLRLCGRDCAKRVSFQILEEYPKCCCGKTKICNRLTKNCLSSGCIAFNRCCCCNFSAVRPPKCLCHYLSSNTVKVGCCRKNEVAEEKVCLDKEGDTLESSCM